MAPISARKAIYTVTVYYSVAKELDSILEIKYMDDQTVECSVITSILREESDEFFRTWYLYLDEECTIPFEDTVITENITVYATQKAPNENSSNNIFLSNQEVDIIKTAYLEAKKDWCLGLGALAENFEILHCLGKTEGKYIVIIRGDHEAEFSIPEFSQIYFIYCESLGKIFCFNYLPEQISVIYQEVYYTLQEAYDLSIISDTELIDIHNNFSMIN